jgi:hypothetical protein
MTRCLSAQSSGLLVEEMNKAGEITFSQGVAEAGAKDNEPLQFHEGASDDCNCCNAGPLDRHYDPERIRKPF